MTWLAQWRRRTRRELTASAIVLAGLTLFVVLVYVVIVLGAGVVLAHRSSPGLGLSVLATAVVAVAFDPVQTRLQGFAARIVHGGGPAPYDVLRRFFSTVTGSYRAEDQPVRMARVLAEGTGAAWSQVWLMVGDRLRLAATWPPEATREAAPGETQPSEDGAAGRRVLRVRHGGETLGVLVVQERTHVPLTSVEERLFTGLAGQAGLVLRSARLRAELEHRLEELSERAEDLRASRQRLIDVQDDRRRALERDIHDGAQQHLVALTVNLRLAHTLVGRSPDRARALLAAQEQATADAVDTLVRLSRGIYPPLLAEHGLSVALRADAQTSPVPVEVVAEGVGRYAPSIEAAAYFSCLEALQNAVKHSGSPSIRVELSGRPDTLQVTVSDRGSGFDLDTVPVGTGLVNLRARVESAGGTLATESAPGLGTRLEVVLPLVPALAAGGSA